MRHVDALSRAANGEPTEEDLETAADKIPINVLRAEMPLSDWIAIAQKEDARCQVIREIFERGSKKGENHSCEGVHR